MNLHEKLKFLFFTMLFSFSILSNGYTQKTCVKHPEWSRDLSIYEVNIRQYTNEGTFKAFEKSLPRLKKMGVGILWLMPINPIGELNRKGSLGSYYSVRDYTAVNPEFGTLADFKHLVNAIHKQGMYVIIDWVANHTAWDNVWLKTHPDFFTKDSLGHNVSPVPDWTDVMDLNYDNKNLRKEMLKAMEYWVTECNIDGFRCDVAAMVPVEFWNHARKELDKIKPVFMLAEANEAFLQDKAFDMTYNWPLKDLINDIAHGKKSALDAELLFNDEKESYNPDAYRMLFITNHDENSWNGTEFERLKDAAEMFAVFTGVAPGMPLIYTGQEAALNKRLRFFDKDTIEWKDSKYAHIYKTLFELKKKNHALWNGTEGGEMVLIKTDKEKNIFAFSRQKGKDRIVAIFNFSPKQQTFNFPADTLAGKYKNVFTGKPFELKKDNSLTLDKWGYLILK